MTSPFNKLSNDVSATGQIQPDQMDDISAAGFKSIIVNRPDHEVSGQPSFVDTQKAADASSLATAYIPLQPGQLTPEIIAQMAEAVDTLPKPILLHCASGMRSTMLWCFINAKENGVDGVIQSAQDAGYDVSKLRPALQQYTS